MRHCVRNPLEHKLSLRLSRERERCSKHPPGLVGSGGLADGGGERGLTVVLAQIPLTLCLAGSLPVCCLLLTLTLLVTSTQQSIQAQHCLLAGGREGLPGEPRVLGAGGGRVVDIVSASTYCECETPGSGRMQ